VGTRRSITPASLSDGRLCQELTEFNIATCQLEKRLNKAQPVVVERVDVYDVPHLKSRFEAKCDELAVRAGGVYDPLIVFHGTTEAAIPSIMSGGFEVGGGGKVPIRTGTLLGKGVYTSLNATVPDRYVAGGGGGTVTKKLIMAVAVEGKRGGASPDAAMRAASDSWRNASDGSIVVFKSGEQLHPKWVVHYR